MTDGIRNIFSEVPATYELLNHILTFGLDILWRREAARTALCTGGERWMDLCTGTGEMASYLRRFAKNGTKVYATDFSFPMIEKAREKPEGDRISFLLSDIRSLPFSDETFDRITTSFATRNIDLGRAALVRTFKEFYRVLKPGGRFVSLETSQPSFSPVRRLFHGYVKRFVVPIGRRISGSSLGYAYLAKTISRFYDAEALGDIMSLAGFREITIKRLMFGVAAIHQGVKTKDLS